MTWTKLKPLLRAKLLQSYLTLCDLMECSPLGSSVHGILQAKMLEWVAIFSFRGSSRLRDQTHVFHVSCTDWEAGSSPLVPQLLLSLNFLMCKMHKYMP